MDVLYIASFRENCFTITRHHVDRGISHPTGGRGPHTSSVSPFLKQLGLFPCSEPLFAASTVVADDNTVYHSNKTYRDSWTAFLNSPRPKERPDDAVVRCIEERAALFQGFIPIETMETLQLVKYLSLP